MPIYDHDCKMYRFPSFHETLTCDQAKTAQESLKDILIKFPSNTSTSSAASTRSSASPPSSSASSAASSPPAPPHPLPSSQTKRPSNASDYKWINNGPRSSSSSASSKSSSSSSRNRQTSVGSSGRRSPTSRSINSRHGV